jgi:single-stranded-DNA-specific exonuclease
MLSIDVPLPAVQRRTVDREVERLALQSKYDPVVARVLAGRVQSTSRELALALGPTLNDLDDECLLADMEAAAQRLAGAIVSNEVIGIATDYDMDGLGAHAAFRMALVHVFGHPPQRLRSYIGHRLAEGYGLTSAMADRVIADTSRPAVLVTADSGSTDEPRIARLHGEGIDVIVTDHHGMQAEGPPPSAFACINPQREDCKYPDKSIAGGMVLWLLLRAVQRILIDVGHTSVAQTCLEELLDFVCCSTVADCVSMASRNNRAVVIAGLAQMNSLRRPCWQAMADLLDLRAFRSESIAYGVAPRINARTRLADPFAALRFLLSANRSSATSSLSLLDRENEARKAIERKMLDDALLDRAARLVGDGCHTLCLELPNGHPGVQGICSARLVEAFGLPVFLFSPHAADPDVLTGSARTVDAVDVKQLLLGVDHRAPGLMQGFGGHKAAAGARIRKSDFATFATLFEEAAKEVGGVPAGALRWSDGPLDLRDATLELFDKLQVLEPTGKGFEAPSFDGEFRVVNVRPIGDGTHLRVQLHQSGLEVSAMWFRARRDSTHPLPVLPGELAHFVYGLAENRFRGRRRMDLCISARVRGCGSVPSSQ